MNATQKKSLRNAFDQIELAKQTIEEVESELRDVIEGKSERWRESEKGEQAEAERQSLEEAASYCDNIISNLSEAGI